MSRLVCVVIVTILAVALLSPALLGQDAGAAKTVPPQQVHVAGDATLTVQLSRSVVMVVEPFELTMTIVAPNGSQVALPDIPSKLGDFDVVDIRKVTDIPARQPGMRQWQMTVQLESVLTGQKNIPSLQAVYAAAKGSSGNRPAGDVVISTEPLVVEVQSVLQSGDDSPRDIKEVIDVPLPPTERGAAWIPALLLLVASTMVIWLLLRKRRADPLKQATHQLDLLGEGSRNAANASVSVLRNYIEDQFNVPATKLTAQELVQAIDSVMVLPDADREKLESLLREVDETKYASALPGPASAAAVPTVRQIIALPHRESMGA